MANKQTATGPGPDMAGMATSVTMPVMGAPEELIFANSDINRSQLSDLVGKSLQGTDDGELFLEYRQTESFAFDDGRLKNASFDTSQGFGLRAVKDEASGYAHAYEISEAALRRAAESLSPVKSWRAGVYTQKPAGTNQHLYTSDNPVLGASFTDKTRLLAEIDAYARSVDPRVRQVSASLAGEWQVVEIIRADGALVRDIRPLVRLNVSVVMGEGDRLELGTSGTGGRTGYAPYLDPSRWRTEVDEAIRQASVNLQAVDAPAGEMDVILGPGWPGILLHEAVGHGLEGDFNRKKTSAFAGLLGEKVAAAGVTVIDDGTLIDRRGSLSVDDEGTPTSRTVLIEDGILKGYMQDRLNARLMGQAPTGNGRRQSFAHAPMPRMTNTFMLGGKDDPQELLSRVKRGLYAVSFGGGQVDITSGKFVFSCTEAYLVENGKIGAPVKGATLIGHGPTALTRVRGVGNDLKLDNGIGTCGKAGQGVPVGVGQPTLLIDGLTVGGTNAG